MERSRGDDVTPALYHVGFSSTVDKIPDASVSPICANRALTHRSRTTSYSISSSRAGGSTSGLPALTIRPNPPPPGGTIYDMVLRRDDGTYEIYDIGNNAILAGYELGQVRHRFGLRHARRLQR
jgi:hypothetical protein